MPFPAYPRQFDSLLLHLLLHIPLHPIVHLYYKGIFRIHQEAVDPPGWSLARRAARSFACSPEAACSRLSNSRLPMLFLVALFFGFSCLSCRLLIMSMDGFVTACDYGSLLPFQSSSVWQRQRRDFLGGPCPSHLGAAKTLYCMDRGRGVAGDLYSTVVS